MFIRIRDRTSPARRVKKANHYPFNSASASKISTLKAFSKSQLRESWNVNSIEPDGQKLEA